MIGKAEWFSPRKFGWGVGVRTKEGWLYIVGVMALIFIPSLLPLPFELKVGLMLIIAAVFSIDMLMIIPKVYSKLDEREQKHQLIAERNASLVAIVGLVALLGYASSSQIARGVVSTSIPGEVLPILGILLGMAIAKGATLLYLEREG